MVAKFASKGNKNISYVLCEKAAHIKRVIDKDAQLAIVELTPACAWFCQKYNISYLRLDDFYSSEKLGAANTKDL